MVSHPTPTTAADIAFVRALLVQHLAELPLASTLTVRISAREHHAPSAAALTLLLTTSRERASAPIDEGAACCTPLEYEALALVLEDGRCSREEALCALGRKMGALGHTITLLSLVGALHGREGRTLTCPVRGPMLAVPGIGRAMGGSGSEGGEGGEGGSGPRWTLGQLVDALGGELVAVAIEDGVGA